MKLRRLLALLGLVLGTACNPAANAASGSANAAAGPALAGTPPAAAAAAAAVSGTAPRPAPTSTPLPTSSPSPTPCHAATGDVTTFTVPAPSMGYHIDTRLYLPPCALQTGRRYPVLYLLHGMGFENDQWPRLGVITATNQLIAAGEIAPLIIVMPHEEGLQEYFDPAVVKDLIPYIDAHYPTLNQRLARAIGGLSRGGGWAVHFGLHYPELFGRLGLHSPAVFYGDEANLLEWARLLKGKPKPVVYIDTGEDDATIRSPLWLDQVMTWFNVEHTLLVQPGTHIEKYWASHVRDYLKFYAASWRDLTPAGEPSGPH